MKMSFENMMTEVLLMLTARKACQSVDGIVKVLQTIKDETDHIERKFKESEEEAKSIKGCLHTIMNAVDLMRQGGYEYVEPVAMLAGQYAMAANSHRVMRPNQEHWSLPGLRNITDDSMTSVMRERRDDLIELLDYLIADAPNYVASLEKESTEDEPTSFGRVL
jgi:hypothetical protein